jgi:hypothetical protein
MNDKNEILSQTERQASLAPETHNDEQSDYPSQAQRIAAQAKKHRHKTAGGTESRKPASPGVDNVAGSETDLIDQMREMEDDGEIDNGAYEGEPQHDDNESKYD